MCVIRQMRLEDISSLTIAELSALQDFFNSLDPSIGHPFVVTESNGRLLTIKEPVRVHENKGDYVFGSREYCREYFDFHKGDYIVI